MQYWEDLQPGQQFNTDQLTIRAADIIEFATQFDPQPYHLDPAVAEQSIFGGHCASGWHVCALMMRLLADTMNRDGVPVVGSPGVESLRWLKPVFADDSLHASIAITAVRESTNHAEYGLVDTSIDVRNQHDSSVIVLNTDIMIARRSAAGGT